MHFRVLAKALRLFGGDHVHSDTVVGVLPVVSGGHHWGNAPVANRVALKACVHPRNEERDLAREGNEIIRESSKWSAELAATCQGTKLGLYLEAYVQGGFFILGRKLQATYFLWATGRGVKNSSCTCQKLDGVGVVATWLCQSFVSAFFASLECCSCFQLHTTDGPDGGSTSATSLILNAEKDDSATSHLLNHT
ncbi:unnamed protein product [Sphenostylis stenocarpa]|uniref:Ribulose-1,5-bisphosphate carboxylase/oxygenase large subunit n=1 Tax=Sphenostylis stenocarpa TaxID=92480 RepID=A0AA86VDW2_9FABA|nr:unnamed protein product [Sphenostylis stenocarpa]